MGTKIISNALRNCYIIANVVCDPFNLKLYLFYETKQPNEI